MRKAGPNRVEEKPPCHLCENMKDTCTFKGKHLNEVHNQQKVQLQPKNGSLFNRM